MLFGCNILILLVLTTDNSVCQILSFSKVFDKKKISTFRHDLNIVLKFIIIVVFSDERCGVFAEET